MAIANLAWEAEEIFMRLLVQTPWQGEWHPSEKYGIAVARWGYNVFILDKGNQGVYCVVLEKGEIALKEISSVSEETFTGTPLMRPKSLVSNVSDTILQAVEEAGLGSHIRILARI